MIPHGVGCLAVGHAPLDRALVEIDRREHAVGRFQDRESLHGETAFRAGATTAPAAGASTARGRSGCGSRTAASLCAGRTGGTGGTGRAATSGPAGLARRV